MMNFQQHTVDSYKMMWRPIEHGLRLERFHRCPAGPQWERDTIWLE